MVASTGSDALKALVGGNVGRLRQRSGLTRAKLADRAGLTPGAVWKVERGRFTISLRTLARLAAALGVPISRILQDDQGDGAVLVRGVRPTQGSGRTGNGARHVRLFSVICGNLECDADLTILPELADRRPAPACDGIRFVFVLDGYLAYLHGGSHHFVRPRDGLLFSAEKAHGPVSVAEGGATILSVKVRVPAPAATPSVRQDHVPGQ